MSPALNVSTVLQCFEHGNVVEIHNGIMFDFYPGLFLEKHAPRPSLDNPYAASPKILGLIRAAKLHQCLISLHSSYEPRLNVRTVLQCFEHSNTVEIHNEIMFDFYLGLFLEKHVPRPSLDNLPPKSSIEL